MKTLFDPATLHQVQTRLAQLQPQSERQWGTMTAAQMLAHCANSMQWGVGELVPETLPHPARLLGRLFKPLFFRDDAPMRKNSPTAKSLLVRDQRDFVRERDRLAQLIDRFAANGRAACTTNPHSFFGPLTPEQWGVLTYKHLDHHLRQFGV